MEHQLSFRFPRGQRPARERRASAFSSIIDAGTMQTVELLSRLIGPRSDRVCDALAYYGGLRTLAGIHPQELREKGITESTLSRLGLFFELAKRFGEEEFVPGQPFRGSADVYAHFRERLAAEVQERFYVVLLDNKHRKMRDVLVSLGSLTSSVVHPREVFSRVIRDAAAAVIFAHNHPSGDPTPSAEDLALTRRLREVGELIGVRVLDHVIIGKGRYVSFVDDGYW